ncbi:DUF6634 family protein [Sulfitobacter noctilucae]|uniref:DUF6634 family protein n=1 Tax=Sulfitobacter noctilucae TaxID=1342302 RepID=UPI001268B41A|nr:DUF6634 family protein [Sulfitobacter noctilucae]
MDPNADGLRVIHALRRAEPPAFTKEKGKLYVIADTIPLEALEATESLFPAVKYIKIDGVWCLPADCWNFFRTQLMSTLGTRMTNRSLRFSMLGPTSGELKDAPLLQPWAAIRDPQFGGAILLGIQSGHPTLRSRLINTSRLCGIAADQSWARTASRWYRVQNLLRQEDLVDRLGHQVAGLEHLTLDAWEIRAFVERDQIDAGVRNV